MQITWLSYIGSENQGLPLRSWFVTCWLWRHIPIVMSLVVPSSCVVTQTPMGTNSGTRSRKRKFPLLFVNCDRGRIEIDHLYGLRCRGWYCNPALVVPAGAAASGRATAGTTPAIPDCSTNHSCADPIVVNSYNNVWIATGVIMLKCWNQEPIWQFCGLCCLAIGQITLKAIGLRLYTTQTVCIIS